MIQSTLIKTLLLGTGFSLLALYANCSKVAVSDIKETSLASSSLSDRGNGEFDFEGIFQVGQKTHSDLDLVWVLDNSGSMTEEIAHVKRNLDQFKTSISNQASLKMALISQAGGGNLFYNLDVSDPSRFMQINQEVSSTNALQLTASAFCLSPMDSCSNFKVANVQGKLNSFLRPNAKKIFVIVSDDESQVSPEAFTAAFNQTYPGQSFGLFGFIGLGSQSPCQARTGSRYIQLASQTGGETFNICDMDWTATFSKLAANVLSFVAPSVPLPHATSQVQIMSVVLDGQPLDSSQYKVSSAGIVINIELLQPNRNYKVAIRYRLK